MKITAKSRYALRILLDIAINGGDGLRTIKEIAASQVISEKFISRIAVPLRRAGLLTSEQGIKGGLKLARKPEDITLLDIVVATDGAVALLKCLAHPGACKRRGRCASEIAWQKVNDTFAEALRSQKLSEIIKDQIRLSSASADEPDYCI